LLVKASSSLGAHKVPHPNEELSLMTKFPWVDTFP
jgi:hypothetical protein